MNNKSVIKHIATENGRIVCEVYKNKHNRWEICWGPARQYSREPIANLKAAKAWVSRLLYGKTVEWSILARQNKPE